MADLYDQSEFSVRDDEGLVEHSNQPLKRRRKCQCNIAKGTIFVCIISLLLSCIAMTVALLRLHASILPFHQQILLSDVLEHLDAFQTIADKNGGSRSVLRGFNASCDYVMHVLRKTSLKVSITHFESAAYRQLSPPRLGLMINSVYVPSFDPVEYQVFDFSGNGEIISTMDLAENFGCLDTDYTRRNESAIVLIAKGQCDYYTKIGLAINAGYLAVLIYNDLPWPIFGTLANRDFDIPVFGVSDSLGEDLMSLPEGAIIRLKNNATIIEAVASNIFAETSGDEKNTIVMSAALDSIEEGPGINESGSGAASNLAIAVAFATTHPKNKVVFAWWGGEQTGVKGSEYYIKDMKAQGKLSNIALNLNFDPIGSPNFIRGIYGASVPDSIYKECLKIQQVFQEHFETHELVYDMIQLEADSNSNPFIQNSIPFGSLSSGQDEEKTMEQRKLYGGISGISFDPCYRRQCDTRDNVEEKVLEELMRSMAAAMEDFANHDNLRTFLANPTQ